MLSILLIILVISIFVPLLNMDIILRKKINQCREVYSKLQETNYEGMTVKAVVKDTGEKVDVILGSIDSTDIPGQFIYVYYENTGGSSARSWRQNELDFIQDCNKE